MNIQTIQESFKPLLNDHAWNVKKGHGSFLTFEFGTPEFKFGAPTVRATASFPSNEHPTRQVAIHGKYHLWIYCCNWRISIDKQQIAFEESSDEGIQNAAEFLNGQKLTSVNIDIKNAITRFSFDLGGELLTFNESYGNGAEMWMLYMPKNVLTFNNLGQFSLTNRNTEPKQEIFEQLDLEDIEITP